MPNVPFWNPDMERQWPAWCKLLLLVVALALLVYLAQLIIGDQDWVRRGVIVIYSLLFLVPGLGGFLTLQSLADPNSATYSRKRIVQAAMANLSLACVAGVLVAWTLYICSHLPGSHRFWSCDNLVSMLPWLGTVWSLTWSWSIFRIDRRDLGSKVLLAAVIVGTAILGLMFFSLV